jgi:hypothetical protein
MAESMGAIGCYFLFFCFFAYISLGCLFAFVPSGNWFFILIGLMSLCAGICCLCQPVFAANEHTRIHIDQKSATVTKTSFGRRQLVFHASRNNLYKLTYVKRLYRPHSEGGIEEVSPELKIWGKTLCQLRCPLPRHQLSHRAIGECG